VLERGATSRVVDLPAGTTWYDWWTGAVATSGAVPAPVGTIPVFAPAGAIVPLYTTIPDTLVDGPLPGLVTRSDADTERTVRVYAGARGSFTEADGTRYTSDGTATVSGSTSATLSSGELSVNGLHLIVTGPVARRYTLEVIAP
jgi:alpha-glucosidase (family GH31 glycosyl hydrolase)